MSADRVELAVRELVDALRAEVTPPPEPTTMVSIAEAAELLSVSRTSLYALMDSGELDSRHIGRRRLVPRAELDRFTAEREPSTPMT
jgi:excisionase family DNA binding protein